jgi:cyclic-di-GMP phosphodiesterase TipF (flagellum assembly factor)
MVRLGAIFVAVCIVLIAGSLGAWAYLSVGLSGAEASVLALALLTALGLYNTVSTRVRDRSDVGTQIADLSRGTADLAKQVAETGRRIAALETKVEGAANKPRSSIADPVAVELGELGTLVKQLAETVAAHDTAIKAVSSSPQAVSAQMPLLAPTGRNPLPEMLGAPPAPRVVEMAPQPVSDSQAMITQVRNAVDAGRIDLYLQPIVTLPQRKVRYYEALSRMRSEDGDIIAAADFLDYAEAGGLMGKIDNLALFRSVQVVRRLMMKNREIGMFCNIAGSTLADSDFFPQLIEFVDANRALASSLVFELSQKTARSLGPIEQESLAALAERGFRFSMDQVTDLRIEGRELSERGFRFVKVPAALLMSRATNAVGDIHTADLSDLLGRFGIELIASHVETEGVVVDLLDFDVRYGQGLLFSAPRPVRQEALRGGSERTEGVARAEPAGDDKPAARAAGQGGGGGGLFHRQSGLAQLARGAFDPA